MYVRLYFFFFFAIFVVVFFIFPSPPFWHDLFYFKSDVPTTATGEIYRNRPRLPNNIRGNHSKRVKTRENSRRRACWVYGGPYAAHLFETVAAAADVSAAMCIRWWSEDSPDPTVSYVTVFTVIF